MSGRRRSVHLAAAVSSILSAPAIAVARAFAITAPRAVRAGAGNDQSAIDRLCRRGTASRSRALKSRSSTCPPNHDFELHDRFLPRPVLGHRPACRRPISRHGENRGHAGHDRRESLHRTRAAHLSNAGRAADRAAHRRRGDGCGRARLVDRCGRRFGSRTCRTCRRSAVTSRTSCASTRKPGWTRPIRTRSKSRASTIATTRHDRWCPAERRLRPEQQRLPDPAQPVVDRRDPGRLDPDCAVLGRIRPSSAARRSTS